MPTELSYWISVALAGGLGRIAYWTMSQGRRALARVRRMRR